MAQIEHREVPTLGKAESILAAAKRAFLAAGFGAVSMDTIAREAGVSKATVYAHFGSKEELFGAVIERECEQYFDRFSAGELDPRDVRASLTIFGPPFSRAHSVARRDRVAPHHLGRGYPLPDARRSVLARRTGARTCPDRGFPAQCGGRRRIDAARPAARRRAIRQPRARRCPAAPSAPPRSQAQRA